MSCLFGRFGRGSLTDFSICSIRRHTKENDEWKIGK